MRRLLKSCLAAGAALIVGAGVTLATAGPANASVATYPVMNTSETLPDGVWFRNSPVNSDTNRETGFGVYAGERLAVDCFAWGDPVGSYGNRVWYRGLDVERPVINGHANYGYMNTHYINDGMTANSPAPGIPDCNAPAPSPNPTPSPSPSAKPCTFNMRWDHLALTFNYGGKHRYYGNAWQAAKNWSNVASPIKVTPAASGSTADITFTDVSYPKVGWVGQTQVPAAWQSTNPPSDTPFMTHLSSYQTPTHISIYVNRALMEGLNDFQRTKVLTHELGHALGLGHTDRCGLSDLSVMNTAASGVLMYPFNSPQYYDKINLQQLYGLPTG